MAFSRCLKLNQDDFICRHGTAFFTSTLKATHLPGKRAQFADGHAPWHHAVIAARYLHLLHSLYSSHATCVLRGDNEND